MTQPPEFNGPTQQERLYSNGQPFVDFYRTCRIQYPVNSVDDGARFDVVLTIDSVPSVHVITNSSELDVNFTSGQLKAMSRNR